MTNAEAVLGGSTPIFGFPLARRGAPFVIVPAFLLVEIGAQEYYITAAHGRHILRR